MRGCWHLRVVVPTSHGILTGIPSHGPLSCLFCPAPQDLKLPPVVAFATCPVRERDWYNILSCHEGMHMARHAHTLPSTRFPAGLTAMPWAGAGSQRQKAWDHTRSNPQLASMPQSRLAGHDIPCPMHAVTAIVHRITHSALGHTGSCL